MLVLMKTITIEEYYKVQYNVTISDPNQPLLIAERKTKSKKLPQLSNGNTSSASTTSNNITEKENKIIRFPGSIITSFFFLIV